MVVTGSPLSCIRLANADSREGDAPGVGFEREPFRLVFTDRELAMRPFCTQRAVG